MFVCVWYVLSIMRMIMVMIILILMLVFPKVQDQGVGSVSQGLGRQRASGLEYSVFLRFLHILGCRKRSSQGLGSYMFPKVQEMFPRVQDQGLGNVSQALGLGVRDANFDCLFGWVWFVVVVNCFVKVLVVFRGWLGFVCFKVYLVGYFYLSI